MHFGYICIEDSMAMKLFSPPYSNKVLGLNLAAI